jgi:hypothetical protein
MSRGEIRIISQIQFVLIVVIKKFKLYLTGKTENEFLNPI